MLPVTGTDPASRIPGIKPLFARGLLPVIPEEPPRLCLPMAPIRLVHVPGMVLYAKTGCVLTLEGGYGSALDTYA